MVVILPPGTRDLQSSAPATNPILALTEGAEGA
jgi:hypothetical protein